MVVRPIHRSGSLRESVNHLVAQLVALNDYSRREIVLNEDGGLRKAAQRVDVWMVLTRGDRDAKRGYLSVVYDAVGERSDMCLGGTGTISYPSWLVSSDAHR